LTDRDNLVHVPRLNRRVDGNTDGPTTRRWWTGHCYVTTYTHQDPGFQLISDSRGSPINHESLGRRSEIKANAAWYANGPRACIELDVTKANDWTERVRPKRRLVIDLIKIADIAKRRHGIADRGVNSSTSHPRTETATSSASKSNEETLTEVPANA
jgi:hypothetical protein